MDREIRFSEDVVYDCLGFLHLLELHCFRRLMQMNLNQIRREMLRGLLDRFLQPKLLEYVLFFVLKI